MDAHAIFNAFSTFQQSFHSWWNTAQTPFWWLSQTQVNNPTIISNYIIRWILHPFWLALMYDLSEDRRIDDVTINDILLFYHAKQTDSLFLYICSVKGHSCGKNKKTVVRTKWGHARRSRVCYWWEWSVLRMPKNTIQWPDFGSNPDLSTLSPARLLSSVSYVYNVLLVNMEMNFSLLSYKFHYYLSGHFNLCGMENQRTSPWARDWKRNAPGHGPVSLSYQWKT